MKIRIEKRKKKMQMLHSLCFFDDRLKSLLDNAITENWKNLRISQNADEIAFKVRRKRVFLDILENGLTLKIEKKALR